MSNLLDRDYVKTLMPVTAHQEREEGLEPSDLAAAYRAMLEQQLELVEQQLELMTAEARWHAGLFLGAAEASMDAGESDKFCRIGTRATYRDGTLSIQWLRNRYVRQGEGKPSKVYSTYIKKGAGFAYSMNEFKREPGWVKEIVEVTEREYAALRERAASLRVVRTELRKMLRRLPEY